MAVDKPGPNVPKVMKNYYSQFAFYYLRFKCADFLGTVDFYQTLGMQLAYKLDVPTLNGNKQICSLIFTHTPGQQLLFEYTMDYKRAYNETNRLDYLSRAPS